LKLEAFYYSGYAGESIDFLFGMPLKKVILNGAKQLKSIDPLRMAPIEELDITGNDAITDLSALGAMPLRQLSIGTPAANDLSVLQGKELESLRISMDMPDFRFLRKCRVSRLTVHGNLSARNLDGFQSQIEHLEELHLWGGTGGAQLGDINALRGMKRLKVLRMGGLPVRELSVLKGLPLAEVHLVLGQCDSTAGLEGAQIRHLTLGGSFIDIRSLKSMSSLTHLDLSQCHKLKNVKVLGALNNLQEVLLPEAATDIDFLRRKRIRQIGLGNRPRAAPGFWNEIDARRKRKSKYKLSGVQ